MEKTEGILLVSLLSAIAAALIILPMTPAPGGGCEYHAPTELQAEPTRTPKRISGSHTAPVEDAQRPRIQFVKHRSTSL